VENSYQEITERALAGVLFRHKNVTSVVKAAQRVGGPERDLRELARELLLLAVKVTFSALFTTSDARPHLYVTENRLSYADCNLQSMIL
jgi:hypothetical protein